MARRAPNTSTGGALAARVVYLPDPLTAREPVHYSPAQRVAKRQRDREAYLVWRERQLALIEHDRRVRRFVLRAGLAVATGLLATVCGIGWWLWQSIKAATFHIDGGMVLLVIVVLIVAGAKVGHHCVTTVTHRH